MRSQVRIGDVPLHPLLILVPVGAFALTLVLDVVFALGGDAGAWRATRPVIAIGIGGALLAAIPGVIDLFAVAPKRGASAVALLHGVINLVVVGLFAVNLATRLAMDGAPADGVYRGLYLTIAGIALLGISGPLGVWMTHGLRVGLPDAADRDRTGPFMDRLDTTGPYGGGPYEAEPPPTSTRIEQVRRPDLDGPH